MKVITERQELIQARSAITAKVALVPTMGNLHSGHLALVEYAHTKADYIIATIFVNPMQFSANEDLDNYPRTLENDLNALEAAGVDLVFTPDSSQIYPDGVERHTQITVPDLSELHCGAHRAGHFTGVSTIVCKLLNLCQPDIAVFGQKDYQQLAIIKKMVSDLCIPIQILSIPTVRLSSGLALSSRNNYLSRSQQEQAANLHQNLVLIKEQILQGERDYLALQQQAINTLNSLGFEMEYLNVVDQDSLLPAKNDCKKMVILVAGKLGSTRLIDNIEVLIS